MQIIGQHVFAIKKVEFGWKKAAKYHAQRN